MAMYSFTQLTLTSAGEPVQLDAARVTPSLDRSGVIAQHAAFADAEAAASATMMPARFERLGRFLEAWRPLVTPRLARRAASSSRS